VPSVFTIQGVSGHADKCKRVRGKGGKQRLLCHTGKGPTGWQFVKDHSRKK
jgi:hypothetical protein